jgi:hypothetical protein
MAKTIKKLALTREVVRTLKVSTRVRTGDAFSKPQQTHGPECVISPQTSNTMPSHGKNPLTWYLPPDEPLGMPPANGRG